VQKINKSKCNNLLQLSYSDNSIKLEFVSIGACKVASSKLPGTEVLTAIVKIETIGNVLQQTIFGEKVYLGCKITILSIRYCAHCA
jgi:hypothetical protein